MAREGLQILLGGYIYGRRHCRAKTDLHVTNRGLVLRRHERLHAYKPGANPFAL